MTEALEKITRMNMLFDFCEPLLTEEQRTVLRHYYHDNYSLGEISELFRISRQAMYEHLKRAGQTLEDYEEKLELLGKHEMQQAAIAEIRAAVRSHPAIAGRVKPWLEKLEQLD